MEAFAELVRLYGLPLAVLLGALAICGRVIIVLWKDLKASYEARLQDKENEIEKGRLREEYFRTKYEQTTELLEASTEATVVATGSRRPHRR